MLAAPTGRAAKRMIETTGHEAKTIHRLLEYDFQSAGFQKDNDSPLDCDLMIVDIDREMQEVIVRIDDREVPYDYAELDEIVLAYAVSVHKSQGSEYPVIVMPILTQHYMLLHRNLVYTGITRGKKLVVMIGTKKAMAIAIRNDKAEGRYTYLGERLRKRQKGS